MAIRFSYLLVVLLVLGLGACVPPLEKPPYLLLPLITHSMSMATPPDTQPLPNNPNPNPNNLGQVATPVFTPSGGHYNSPIVISITSATPGATIYFTLDGTLPSTNSFLYNGALPIWVVKGKLIQAFAVAPGMIDSGVASAIYSAPPIQTGLTNSYAVGDDGQYMMGLSRGYSDNGNGTITDLATGLVWQKCTYGQSGSLCTGTPVLAQKSTAQTNCNNLSLAGLSWRLPTRYELLTLTHYGVVSAPRIDTSIFPNTLNDYYWTSTVAANNSTNSWIVHTSLASLSSTVSNASLSYYRCVSGLSRDYYGNFRDMGDGTIIDHSTGLYWQKCSNGQTNDATCSGTATTSNWSTAISYCNNLTLASKIWRLPSINELISIADTEKVNPPAINGTYFPNTSSTGYWSSTTNSLNTSAAITVNFTDGSVSSVSKSITLPIRCVSGP